jgi:hypothetical protein
VQTRQGLAMLLHLGAAEQFRSQRRLGEAILPSRTVSAETRPEIQQVPENRLARLQVGLLFRSKLSTNQDETRLAGLDASPPPVIIA